MSARSPSNQDCSQGKRQRGLECPLPGCSAFVPKWYCAQPVSKDVAGNALRLSNSTNTGYEAVFFRRTVKQARQHTVSKRPFHVVTFTKGQEPQILSRHTTAVEAARAYAAWLSATKRVTQSAIEKRSMAAPREAQELKQTLPKGWKEQLIEREGRAPVKVYEPPVGSNLPRTASKVAAWRASEASSAAAARMRCP